MPSKPRTAAKAAAQLTVAPADPAEPVDGEVFKSWDQYQEESQVEPFELPLPTGERLLIKCPTGGALRRLTRAQVTGDLEAIIENAFGDCAEAVWALAEDAPYPAILKLSNDVLTHYGRRAQDLGE